MTAETDIANAALGEIGASTITSFTDGSKNANKIGVQYPLVLSDLLEGHDWNFATKRIKLARSSTAPVSEFAYAYPVPSDFRHLIRASDSDAGRPGLNFRQEIVGDQICIITNSDQVYLRYCAQVIDLNTMPATFLKALRFELARSVAVSIANSNTLQREMRDKAEEALTRAKSKDSMGATPENRPRGSWASARSGNRWPQ